MKARGMRRATLFGALALGAFGLGLWQAGEAGYIHAKAWLAQRLIEGAWARTLAGEARVRPWPWADTWPVAALEARRLGERSIVLAGGSGRTLAFAPGHVDGSALPGAPGNSVIGGHRDTHFRFLEELRPGDEIRVQGRDGGWRRFRVAAAEVVDSRTARLDPQADRPGLILVTCYPFDAIVPGGPLRYVVFAEEETLLGARPEPLPRAAARGGTRPKSPGKV